MKSIPVKKSASGKSPRKTAFVPRLAYGCVGLGMGVIPLCAASSACNSGPVSSTSSDVDASDLDTGIVPYIPDDASASDGVHPYIPDDASASDGVAPYIPDASPDGDARDAGGEDASHSTTDASGD
jgi:hypothetical protein